LASSPIPRTARAAKRGSSGGKERLGRITKMGDSTIRRLLVTGALSVIRWGRLKPGFAGSWIGQLMARKLLKLAAVVLANKMARIV
jgi:transposase